VKFATKDLIVGSLTRTIFKSSSVRRVAIDFGRAARFDSFLIAQNVEVKRLKSREKLYFEMINRADYLTNPEESLIVLEFGVADGEGTSFWSRKIRHPQMKYVGFDSFLGLNEDWMIDGLKYHSKGYFARNGHPDFSSDKRISFCVGFVEDNEDKIMEISRMPGQKFYLFDMDLYKPTKFVWELIKPLLNHGDIVYFDEAFDLEGEGLIIRDEILSQSEKWEYLGHSAIATAFQYK